MEEIIMEKRDLKLSGATVATGGEYRDVRVSGASKITSDILCETMNISGAITVDGNVDAKSCKVSGACKISGNVKSDEIRISGGSSITGTLTGKEITLAGGIKVGGDIKSNMLKLSGEITVGGDMECEEFRLSGGINSKGVVNCEKCELELAARSELNELVGTYISVREGNGVTGGIIKNLLGKGKGSLKVNLVEGDEIYLENTTCEMVRGEKITIGPGCRIGTVEYAELLEFHSDSRVENKIER